MVDFSACSGFSVVRFFRICHAVCSIIAKLALANNALITIVAAPNVKRGIAVNVVAPGAIETDFGGGAVRDNPQLNAYVASQTALGRVGGPDDIGGMIAALLSEDCRWINGQRIEVSGGMFL